MTQPSARSPQADPSRDTALSFLNGLGLGAIVWLLADVQRGNMASFTMAVVLLASASAAVVAFLLSREAAPVSLQQRAGEIHHWLGAIGSGVLVAILGLNAI